MHVDLPLVVGGPSGEHAIAPDDRLEWSRFSQLQRVDRLNVVVTVDDRRRGAFGMEPVAVNDWVRARLGDLDMLRADPPEVRREPLRRLPAVVLVLGQRGNAR